MPSTSLKKTSEQTYSEASLPSLCVNFIKLRTSGSGTRSKTIVYGKTDFPRQKEPELQGLPLGGAPDRRGPGRPFGDFSDGAEKSLAPGREILLSLPRRAKLS